MFKKSTQNIFIVLILMGIAYLPFQAQAAEIQYAPTPMTIKNGEIITATFSPGAPIVTNGMVQFFQMPNDAKFSVDWGGAICYHGPPCGTELPHVVTNSNKDDMLFTLGSAPSYTIKFTNITGRTITITAQKTNNPF